MSSSKKALVPSAPILLLACLALSGVPGFADSASDSLTIYNPARRAVYQLTATESELLNGQSPFLVPNPALANPARGGMDIGICDQSPCNTSTAPGFISDILGVFPVTSGAQTNYYLGFMSPDEKMGTFQGAVIGYAIEMPGGIPIKATQYLAANKQAAG